MLTVSGTSFTTPYFSDTSTKATEYSTPAGIPSTFMLPAFTLIVSVAFARLLVLYVPSKFFSNVNISCVSLFIIIYFERGVYFCVLSSAVYIALNVNEPLGIFFCISTLTVLVAFSYTITCLSSGTKYPSGTLVHTNVYVPTGNPFIINFLFCTTNSLPNFPNDTTFPCSFNNLNFTPGIALFSSSTTYTTVFVTDVISCCSASTLLKLSRESCPPNPNFVFISF